MKESVYGLPLLERAIRYCPKRGEALDVGCGSGGRMIDLLLSEGFGLKAIDISPRMIELARARHPTVDFQIADVRTWEPGRKYDLVVAWDSIFHLPAIDQAPVLAKLCAALKDGGILLYTIGDAVGDQTDVMFEEMFSYGSIGIEANLRKIAECGCSCRHLEMDQFPAKHVCIIVQRA